MFDFDVRSADGAPPRPTAAGASSSSSQVFAEILRAPIARVQRRPTLTLSVSSTVEEAMSKMLEHQATSALVSSKGRAVGTIDQRDVARLLLEAPRWRQGGSVSASAVGIWQLWSVPGPDQLLLEAEPVATALARLGVAGATALPLASGSGELSGVLEPQDLLAWVARQTAKPT